MESNWAAENLQTIRTLMERSAVYRRALAPVTTYVGIVGIAGGVAGQLLKIVNGGVFAVYWMAISLVAIGGAVLLVRRQALKSGEPFWSPPTRRIAQAMFPPLLVGCMLGIWTAIWTAISSVFNSDRSDDLLYLVPAWGVLYGLALNSAGFFMPRGIKLFGWIFIGASVGMLYFFLFLAGIEEYMHLVMGVLFGASHLAYGIYLYFTEPRKNEA
jgi:hypothetical protein